MTTISAKELRDNLDQVIQRVKYGEDIRVTYRSKPALRLVSDEPKQKKVQPGSPEAMQRFIKRVEARRKTTGSPVFDPHKSIKELYHEMLDNDPKYQ